MVVVKMVVHSQQWFVKLSDPT